MLHLKITKELTCLWDKKGNWFAYWKLVNKIEKLRELSYQSVGGSIPNCIFVQRKIALFKKMMQHCLWSAVVCVMDSLEECTITYFGQNHRRACISEAHLLYFSHKAFQTGLHIVPNMKPFEFHSVSITFQYEHFSTDTFSLVCVRSSITQCILKWSEKRCNY